MPYLCIRKCKVEGNIYKEGELYKGTSKDVPHHFKEVGITPKTTKKSTQAK